MLKAIERAVQARPRALSSAIFLHVLQTRFISASAPFNKTRGKPRRVKRTKGGALRASKHPVSPKTTAERDTRLKKHANENASQSKHQEDKQHASAKHTDANSDAGEAAPAAQPLTSPTPKTSVETRPTTFLYGEDAHKARIVRFEECEREQHIQHRFGRLHDSQVVIEPVKPLRRMHVAKLAHGLDRVLFNPGVHWLRDEHTGMYNYTRKLQHVLDVDLFDYDTLPPYITSSRDKELLQITQRQKRKYCGSTSSLTGLLSQCYFMLSRWKEPELTGFSPSFQDLPTGFSEGAKLPVSIMLRYQPGGFYAIDAAKGSDEEIDNTNYLLTSLGKSLEKFLTSTPQEYALHHRVNSSKLDPKVREQQEAYHYAQSSKFVLRSQLDCFDKRLPNRTFDLKTRACVSIRNDRANYAEGCGYQIRYARGLWESFEREYWDMVRAAFLKYNFQVRIGHMDGIFVAYHNTAQIFGFQYISLEEMNLRLFGSNEMGDKAYRLSIGLLELILDTATEHMPNETLALSMDTRPGGTMNVIVESTTSTKIFLLEVTMDRYLNDALVNGPVNFSQFHRPANHAEVEDMQRGRHIPHLRDIDWHVNYCITLRDDLSEAEVRAKLQRIHTRQRIMRTMCQPNVAKLNARESHRVQTLARKPGALERFLHERENGPAVGMPLAPGQKTTREIIRSKSLLDIEPDGALLPTTPIKWVRFPDPMTRRVRELSREGLKSVQSSHQRRRNQRQR